MGGRIPRGGRDPQALRCAVPRTGHPGRRLRGAGQAPGRAAVGSAMTLLGTPAMTLPGTPAGTPVRGDALQPGGNFRLRVVERARARDHAGVEFGGTVP